MFAEASVLSRWENFYVILGSSAGALTGLQFVVIALIKDTRIKSSMTQIRAFGTPTVVHFCAALLVSAIVSAPWEDLTNAGFALVACGVSGVVYGLGIIVHARRQHGYQPEAEDWVWYFGIPITAYGFLLVSGLRLPLHAHTAMFLVGIATLSLLFVGIHNAWDTVTYIAIGRHDDQESGSEPRGST